MKRIIVESAVPAAAVVMVAAVFVTVSTMDYSDAVAASDHYAEMVCGGYWPDYENRNPDCGE